MNYDSAVGLDNPTLNTLIEQVYKALYPNLLKSTVKVEQYGFASVSFDINAAPSVNLSPSAAANAHFEAAIDNNYGDTASLTDSSISSLLSLANAASFNFNVPSIALTINYTNNPVPTNANASLMGAVNIQSITKDGKNWLTVEILTATIDIASDPSLTAVLNNALVPQILIPYLNEHILTPIKVDVSLLKYKSLQVSLPVPVVQTPYVTAYSALGSTQPDIPTPYNWPTDCIYIGLDDKALKAAIGTQFPLGPSGEFNWKVFSGQVRAQVLAPENITINNDGSLTATIEANALAQLTLHTPKPLPNFSFGPSATASATINLRPSIQNSVIELSSEEFLFDFDFNWGSIPVWINPFFFPLKLALTTALNAYLNNMILPIVLEAVREAQITLPAISLDYQGSRINITIKDAIPSGENSLLLIKAHAAVS